MSTLSDPPHVSAAVRASRGYIHRAGWPFIGLFAAATAGLYLIHPALGLVGVPLTIWCAAFFRDPERTPPAGDGLVLSAADGVVQMIDEAAPPPELEMGDAPRPRVAVFMNVFNVHVNRSPAAGTVTKTSYRPGKFLNAALDKASVDNERQSVRMTLAGGGELALCQIAGLVARRILCWADEGQPLSPGERFGMIRFGSRVDHYLPPGSKIRVAVGEKSTAGETILADLPAPGTAAPAGE